MVLSQIASSVVSNTTRVLSKSLFRAWCPGRTQRTLAKVPYSSHDTSGCLWIVTLWLGRGIAFTCSFTSHSMKFMASWSEGLVNTFLCLMGTQSLASAAPILQAGRTYPSLFSSLLGLVPCPSSIKKRYATSPMRTLVMDASHFRRSYYVDHLIIILPTCFCLA